MWRLGVRENKNIELPQSEIVSASPDEEAQFRKMLKRTLKAKSRCGT
jgi:hypothetical protein